MLTQRPCSAGPAGMRKRHARWPNLLLLLAALSLLCGCVSTSVRTAKDAAGKPLALSGTVALIEPDIELSELGAGGMDEPRQE